MFVAYCGARNSRAQARLLPDGTGAASSPELTMEIRAVVREIEYRVEAHEAVRSALK